MGELEVERARSQRPPAQRPAAADHRPAERRRGADRRPLRRRRRRLQRLRRLHRDLGAAPAADPRHVAQRPVLGVRRGLRRVRRREDQDDRRRLPGRGRPARHRPADPSAAAADLALAMRAAVDAAGDPWQVRIGLHAGPVVAGVIGTQQVRLRPVGRRGQRGQPPRDDGAARPDPGLRGRRRGAGRRVRARAARRDRAQGQGLDRDVPAARRRRATADVGGRRRLRVPAAGPRRPGPLRRRLGAPGLAPTPGAGAARVGASPAQDHGYCAANRRPTTRRVTRSPCRSVVTVDRGSSADLFPQLEPTGLAGDRASLATPPGVEARNRRTRGTGCLAIARGRFDGAGAVRRRWSQPPRAPGGTTPPSRAAARPRQPDRSRPLRSHAAAAAEPPPSGRSPSAEPGTRAAEPAPPRDRRRRQPQRTRRRRAAAPHQTALTAAVSAARPSFASAKSIPVFGSV